MSPQSNSFAKYIIRFLCRRNGAELAPVFDTMTVANRRILLGELGMILEHGGKPPNWVKDKDDEDDDLDDEDERVGIIDAQRKQLVQANERIKILTEQVEQQEKRTADHTKIARQNEKLTLEYRNALERVEELEIRQQELLRVIARVSQTTPFPEEWVPEEPTDPKARSRQHPADVNRALGLAYQGCVRLMDDANKRGDNEGYSAWGVALAAIQVAEGEMRKAREKQDWGKGQ